MIPPIPPGFFFEAMNGLDITLVGVGRGRDGHVLAGAESPGEIAFELTASVGLPDQIAQRDAVAIKVPLNAGGEDGADCGAATSAKAQKSRPLRTSRAVYWMMGLELLGLRPVARDVVEIFGIGTDLLKQSPAGLDVGQVLFALVFAAAFADQAVLAPNAFQSVMADGQIKLANQAARAEGGQSLAEFDELSFAMRWCFMGLMVTGARSPISPDGSFPPPQHQVHLPTPLRLKHFNRARDTM